MRDKRAGQFIAWPTIKDIAPIIENYRDDLAGYDPAFFANDDGNSIGDIRLQVMPNGSWNIHTGDSSYDTDHNGYWGSSNVAPTDTYSDIRSIAHDLIEDAKEHYAQSH